MTEDELRASFVVYFVFGAYMLMKQYLVVGREKRAEIGTDERGSKNCPSFSLCEDSYVRTS